MIMAARRSFREGGLNRSVMGWVAFLLVAPAVGRSQDPFASETTYQAKAASAREQGDLREAEAILREGLRVEGDHDALRPALAAVLIERSLQMDSTDALGRHLAEGLLREAETLYQEMEQRGAPRVDWLPGAIECRRLLGDSVGALARGERWVRESSEENDRSIAASAYVELLLRLEKAPEALSFVASMEALTPALRGLLELRIASITGERERAAKAAHALMSTEGVSRFDIASACWDCYTRQPAWQEPLLLLYTSLLHEASGQPDLLFYRGVTLYYAGDAQAAETDLLRARESPDPRPAVTRFLGLTWLRQGRHADAARLFTSLLEDPGTAQEGLDGLVSVAVDLGRNNRFLEAEPLYLQVLNIDASNEWAHLGLPLCYKGLGDPERAEAAYRAGLAALPEHPQLLNDLALLLWGAGYRPEARDWFARGMGAGSDDATENLGMIKLRVDHDPSAAASLFAQVLRADPAREKSRFYRELCLFGSLMGE